MVIIFVKLNLLRPCQSKGAKYWCKLTSTTSLCKKIPQIVFTSGNRKNPRDLATALDSLPPTQEEQDDKESAAALQVKAAAKQPIILLFVFSQYQCEHFHPSVNLRLSITREFF
jgi:hypothetical protein